VKPSRYNQRVQLTDGRALLFNSYTLNLLALDPLDAAAVGALLDDGSVRPAAGLAARATGLRPLLVQHGFLLDDGIDELALLREARERERYQRQTLSLTVVPSLACNFACTYCYEAARRSRMNVEVQDALVRFVGERLRSGGRLSITWFGGEPLLELPTIERLSKAFMAACERRDVKYGASIVTNGYLLDATVADRLAAVRVTDAQVTVDGPADVHDARRPLRGGGATFHRILYNVKESADRIQIRLRMNVDHTNIGRIGELLELIEKEGLKGKAGFYLGQTYPYSAACQDVAGMCMSDEEFSLLGLNAIVELAERGFSWTFGTPQAKNTVCGAESENAYVVGPTGSLVGCWCDVGEPDAETGHLLEPMNCQRIRCAERWRQRDPFDLECSSCQLLPMCMGGCPYRHRQSGQLACHPWKHHPNEGVRVHHYLKVRQREAEILQVYHRALDSARRLKRGEYDGPTVETSDEQARAVTDELRTDHG